MTEKEKALGEMKKTCIVCKKTFYSREILLLVCSFLCLSKHIKQVSQTISEYDSKPTKNKKKQKNLE